MSGFDQVWSDLGQPRLVLVQLIIERCRPLLEPARSDLGTRDPSSPDLLQGAPGPIQGLGQFYRGLSISLLLAVNPAITNTLISYFLRLATSLKLRAGESRETAREHSATTVGLATGTAKFLATMATYPLIRAKVLQQTTMALRL